MLVFRFSGDIQNPFVFLWILHSWEGGLSPTHAGKSAQIFLVRVRWSFGGSPSEGQWQQEQEPKNKKPINQSKINKYTANQTEVKQAKI